MADICALMLGILDEENTFWMVVIMVEILFKEYYVDSMLGFHQDVAIIEHFLKHRDPHLFQHLQGRFRIHLLVEN